MASLSHSWQRTFFVGKNRLLKIVSVFVIFLAGAFFSLKKHPTQVLLKTPNSRRLLKTSADALLIKYWSQLCQEMCRWCNAATVNHGSAARAQAYACADNTVHPGLKPNHLHISWHNSLQYGVGAVRQACIILCTRNLIDNMRGLDIGGGNTYNFDKWNNWSVSRITHFYLLPLLQDYLQATCLPWKNKINPTEENEHMSRNWRKSLKLQPFSQRCCRLGGRGSSNERITYWQGLPNPTPLRHLRGGGPLMSKWAHWWRFSMLIFRVSF